MKIDDSIKKTGGLPLNPATPRASGAGPAGAPAGAAAATGSGDNVHISSQMKTLAAQVASSGVFDAGKVEQIKAAIADGRFQVDAEKVANGLIESVRDLIQARKH